MPEVDALFGVPQPEKYHPEIDCGVHTLMVVGDAVLTRDLGKAITPPYAAAGLRPGCTWSHRA